MAMDSLAVARHALTGGDPQQEQAFAIYLVDWFLHRVYDELAGPLSDEIAPIPTHPGR